MSASAMHFSRIAARLTASDLLWFFCFCFSLRRDFAVYPSPVILNDRRQSELLLDVQVKGKLCDGRLLVVLEAISQPLAVWSLQFCEVCGFSCDSA